MSIPFPPPVNPMMGLGGPGVPPPLPPGLLGAIGGAPPAPPLMPPQGPGLGFGAPSGMNNPLALQAGINPAGMNPTMMFIMSEMQRMGETDQQGTAPDTKPKPPKGRKKPNIQDIEEKADALVAKWAPRDQRMDDDLSLYRLTQDAAGAGEVVQKNTPYGRSCGIAPAPARSLATRSSSRRTSCPRSADTAITRWGFCIRGGW